MAPIRVVSESAFAPVARVALHPASEPQRLAIEAPPGPLLVLAGPGAGKTFCLTERIRFLIECLGIAPERICAFTFTNKAAGEIAVRLERTLGERAARVKTGTMHSYCAELLREMGSRVGIPRGFGIADEHEQRVMLRRVTMRKRFQTRVLNAWTRYRFLEHPLHTRDAELLERYEELLARRQRIDFDMLLLKAGELLTDPDTAERIGSRWDCVLVDEFQDLNRVQYAIVRDLARGHRHVFAVGDDEQSIYSWAGADPSVFREYANEFGITQPIHLRHNHRCPAQVMDRASRLIALNTPIFDAPRERRTDRTSPFEICALTFPSDDDEIAWVIDDIHRDVQAHALRWGDFALLYRKHEIGDAAEAGFLNACLPCRLAQGRALAEDPVVGYVIAAIRVIAGGDDVDRERFMETMLPQPLVDHARARADESERTLLRQVQRMALELPRDDDDGRKIRKALSALRNLPALGMRHDTLASLVEELLSQTVGEHRTALEDHCDDLTDPLSHDEVAMLAERLASAHGRGAPIAVPLSGGAGIAVKAMLREAGFACVVSDQAPGDVEQVRAGDAPSLGMPLALFKAAQLVRGRTLANAFLDFTAVDIETTDRAVRTAEVVEIAAVRVRNGALVAEYHSLVKPRAPIAPEAARQHRLTETILASSPSFEDVWPTFRDFCGTDVVVAHNGHHFDFPILRRMAKGLDGGWDLNTYDSLLLARALCPGSGRLSDVARYFGIEPGETHRALSDSYTLARVFLALGEAKVVRSRKISLANALDHLGVALALSDIDPLNAEAVLLRDVAVPFALGRYSDCLEQYREEREQLDDPSLPTVADVIERLGGEERMRRIRAEKRAEDRYPAAMARLRRLLSQCANEPLREQITQLLEWVALSRVDGADVDADRVNLLTLHAAKGLEFSRVYVLGVEDGELPGLPRDGPPPKEDIEEARRLLYVGMTRAKERLVLTRVESRGGMATGGHRFLDEMGLVARPVPPTVPP
ncbi:MAG TPA: UvrD-helicase domain-containing protein [Gemmatimonadaceae bacterium]|nr:UvrD-helicase domain-containing protein [Gemmatimonadaceae bacterium]